ncbi:helix-turn-helix domain-containing protein [Streptacidiphilus sp. EB129]|uniref:helix-turn-helix domain-containing protein n=1 Tax=Streptacidiphilus sp. EB129 TaxID=3156262 RepID=UPI003517A41A
MTMHTTPPDDQDPDPDPSSGTVTATEPPVRWRLRMAAAERGVWTAAQLRRLLAERAHLDLSSASVSVLFTGQPSQIKLRTLAALCTALDCTPADLLTLRTTDTPLPSSTPASPAAVAACVPPPRPAPATPVPALLHATPLRRSLPPL